MNNSKNIPEEVFVLLEYLIQLLENWNHSDSHEIIGAKGPLTMKQ